MAFDLPDNDLRQRAFRGALVTYAAQVCRLVIQTAYIIIMSRLLAPADFGLLAMVIPVYGLAMMFQDLGLTQATVQRPQIGPAQISALFWINVAVGVFIATLLVLLAPMIGWFYADPRAISLTRGFAVTVVITSLASQHLALINRSMRFHYLAALDITSYVAGVAGAILLSTVLPGYWALFASYFIITTVTAIGAWCGTAFVPSMPQRTPNMGELLQLGGGITGSNILNFVARNLDNVLIGRVWGDNALGLYDRAYKLLLLPLQQINTPLSRVMLPILARLQHDPVRYRMAYLQAVQQLLMITQPGIVFAVASAGTLVPTLLGEPWRGAAPIFQWLGLAALQQPMVAATHWLFISQGRGQAYMSWGLFNAVTSTSAFLVGLPWGPIGVAAAYSITQFCLRMPVMWWMATRSGPVRLRDLYASAIPHAAASVISLATVVTLRNLFSLDNIVGLMVCLVVSYAAAVLSLMAMTPGRAMLRESLLLIAEVRGRW